MVTSALTEQKRLAHQEPTMADLELAMAYNADLCRRYGRFWRGYEWAHHEMNELLTEWEETRRNEGLTTPVAPAVE